MTSIYKPNLLHVSLHFLHFPIFFFCGCPGEHKVKLSSAFDRRSIQEVDQFLPRDDRGSATGRIRLEKFISSKICRVRNMLEIVICFYCFVMFPNVLRPGRAVHCIFWSKKPDQQSDH